MPCHILGTQGVVHLGMTIPIGQWIPDSTHLVRVLTNPLGYSSTGCGHPCLPKFFGSSTGITQLDLCFFFFEK